MKYKVLKENDSHFVVHDGKSAFKVAKKGLSAALLGKIQNFADGGDVVRDTSMDAPSTLDLTNVATNFQPPPEMSYEPVPGTMGFQQVAQAPVLPTAHAPTDQPPEPSLNLVGKDGTLQVPGAPGPQQAAGHGSAGLGSDIAKIQGLEIAGVNQARDAQQLLAGAQEKAYDQHLNDIKALQQRTDQQLADNQAEADQLKSNIANGKVDPHRLWNNASTGQRVMGAIGLILGGIGGQGHGNQALEIMQKAIDRDVDAQKEDINNNKTLLNYNMKKYGDIRMAEAATRVQLGTMLQGQLSVAAARSGNALAAAQAKMATGQIESAMLPLKMQMAQQQVKGQSYNGVPANGEMDRFLMGTDPKYAAQRVTVGGQVYRHTGDVKAANEQRIFESKLAPIQAAVQRLDQLGPMAAMRGTAEYNQAQAIRNGLATSIAGLRSTEIGSSRINESEVNHALETIGDPTKFSQMLNGHVRNQEFFKGLHETADSLRSQNLIGYRGNSTVPGLTNGWSIK